jgi:hypothetical protein
MEWLLVHWVAVLSANVGIFIISKKHYSNELWYLTYSILHHTEMYHNEHTTPFKKVLDHVPYSITPYCTLPIIPYHTIQHHNSSDETLSKWSILQSAMMATTARGILQNGRNVQMSQKILKEQRGKSRAIWRRIATFCKSSKETLVWFTLIKQFLQCMLLSSATRAFVYVQLY